MEKKYLIRKALGFAFLMLLSHVSKGQQNNSLYFTDRLPQSIQLNPALQPSATFYFGVPLLSGIEINAGNNALGLSDILIKQNDSLFLPFATKEIGNQTIDKLRKNNIFGGGVQIDILSFGFKINESYISFLISEKINGNTSIPKDLITFANQGITFGDSYNITNLKVNATHYREYSIGYSQKVSDRLYFGIRGKLLFGKANVNLKQLDVALEVPRLDSPDWDKVNVSSSLKVNSSVPHLNIYADASGKPDSLEMKKFSGNQLVSDYILLNKNKGFGVDLGFQYVLTDKVAISGSIVDLGYINWKTNLNTFTGGGDYQFRGIDLQNDSTLEEDLLDSIETAYDATLSNDPYSTSLTPKLYAGISYTPNRFVKVGLLARSEYVLKTFRQQLTGSLIMYPTQFLSATVSYTVADRMYDNLGLGLIFRGGPLQIYLMSDRIPIVWNKVKKSDIPFLPAYSKSVNFRMGINWVFGSNTQRKLKKDQPFLD
jgi:hypothetical protein